MLNFKHDAQGKKKVKDAKIRDRIGTNLFLGFIKRKERTILKKQNQGNCGLNWKKNYWASEPKDKNPSLDKRGRFSHSFWFFFFES